MDVVEVEVCLGRASLTFGSVVERRNGGGETSGGVPVSEPRDGLPPAGSVIRRSEGARTGISTGVVEGDEWSGEATVARVLVGLPLVGKLKPVTRGDTGLAAAMPS